jgi:uncharacterized repeat protein (TIGR03803 family)
VRRLQRVSRFPVAARQRSLFGSCLAATFGATAVLGVARITPAAAANHGFSPAQTSPAFIAAPPALRLPQPGQYGKRRHHPNSSFSYIYDFQGQPDGAQPLAGVTPVGNTLYGTTVGGGVDNGGAVYAITSSGEMVVHSFANTPDGWQPYGGLILVNGTLYGTTYYGGAYGHGAVFSISPSGGENVVYSFGTSGPNDGFEPMCTLLYDNGALYGTTYGGGSGNAHGTVFKLEISGKHAGEESVLYSFQGGNDGAAPEAGLIADKDALYGTTAGGGPAGDGTVFKVTRKGKEKVLHAFAGNPDGSEPVAPLLAYGGNLYGTTEYGGTAPLGNGGGTVFMMTLKGKTTILHSFYFNQSVSDGANPEAGLVDLGGTFYGTTVASGGPSQGAGTVFAITPTGAESLVEVFPNSPSTPPGTPNAPYAPITAVNGVLYGTTLSAVGEGDAGIGTVFGLSPS